MSNTPLVNTNGRANWPIQRSSSCGARILTSKAGASLTPALLHRPAGLDGRWWRRRAADFIARLAIFEHLHDLAHAAGGAGDFHCVVGFLLRYHAKEINHAGLGDDLHLQGVELVRVEKASLDLGGYIRVAGTAAKRGE